MISLLRPYYLFIKTQIFDYEKLIRKTFTKTFVLKLYVICHVSNSKSDCENNYFNYNRF